MTDPRPILFIVDAAIDVTGALIAAASQARLLDDAVRTVLVLPVGHRVPAERLTAFYDVITLPIVPLRKSVGGVLGYLPALLVSSWQLNSAMKLRSCTRLQLNDFNFLYGPVLRRLGFRGRIATFVRIDPARYGTIGTVWLRAARSSSDSIVAVSRFIQSRLDPRFAARLIYAHVEEEAPPERYPDRAQPVFLFVGNYIEGKGQEDAIAAFQQIADRYPRARLRLIGSDMGLDRNRAFRARIEGVARNGQGAERIEFRGPSDDLTEFYRASFAALNFSHSESFSMTCLEAAFAGLPLIATRCGGPEEIVEHEATGFLVPVGDVAGMAARMAWLLDHPTEAAAMGQNGHALVVTRFAPAAARDLYLSLFDVDADPKRIS